MAATFESQDGVPFDEDDAFLKALKRFESSADAIAKRAIYDGAGLLAGEIKGAVGDIPEDEARYLKPGDEYKSITPQEKADLEASMGITPIKGDEFEGWDAKIGFDGYGSRPTKKYPKGVPNQLIARSVEKGTSYRSKYPFMRRTVNRCRKKVVDAMDKSVAETCEKLAE